MAPLVNGITESSGDYRPLSQIPEINSDIILDYSLTDLRMSLKFKSDQTSQCYDEVVLIYSGFPEFLNPLNFSLTHAESNRTGHLLGSFTGAQLANESLSVSSTSVLTVVYYFNTTEPKGFNLLVDVDRLVREGDDYPENATTSQVSGLLLTN